MFSTQSHSNRVDCRTRDDYQSIQAKHLHRAMYHREANHQHKKRSLMCQWQTVAAASALNSEPASRQ